MKRNYQLSELVPNFESFKSTLLKKQRYHVNFADKKYPDAVLENVNLTEKLVTWGVEAVKVRFDGEDWPYAAAYWLMGVAMLSSPNLKLYRLSQNNETLALAIVQHHPIDKFAIGYSFVFANLPDVGVLLVSKLVKFYCENMMHEISYFNASVGTEVGNNPAFVYKRCVGNYPAQSLNLAVRRGDEIEAFPPLYDNGWILG